MTEQERNIFYTVPEVEKMLGLPQSTVYTNVRRGTIPSIKIGRRIVIPARDLANHIGADPATILEGKSIQAGAASPAVPERLPGNTSAPTFTVQATSSNGRASERTNLTAEQKTALEAWLTLDSETKSYTVNKEA